VGLRRDVAPNRRFAGCLGVAQRSWVNSLQRLQYDWDIIVPVDHLSEMNEDNWDELYGLYLAYCTELYAEDNMKQPRKSREEFPTWMISLSAHVRTHLLGYWKKLQQLSEEQVGIERYRWGEALRRVVAGEG